MDKLLIEGGIPLEGTVEVRGAKNAALPILFASLLTDERCVIRNVPHLKDVQSTLSILRELGMGCGRRDDGAIEVELETSDPYTAPYDYVRKMRASVCTLGPLLARRKRAKVSLPGRLCLRCAADRSPSQGARSARRRYPYPPRLRRSRSGRAARHDDLPRGAVWLDGARHRELDDGRDARARHDGHRSRSVRTGDR